METLIIQTEGSKLKLIKQLLKELNIEFEKKEASVSPYDQEFVEKIRRAKNEDSIPVQASSIWEDIKLK